MASVYRMVRVSAPEARLSDDQVVPATVVTERLDYLATIVRQAAQARIDNVFAQR